MTTTAHWLAHYIVQATIIAATIAIIVGALIDDRKDKNQ